MKCFFIFTIAILALPLAMAMGQPVGTTFDLGPSPDGIVDQTYLGNNTWDPPMTGFPPIGTIVVLGDTGERGTLIDSDGNGQGDTLVMDNGDTIDFTGVGEPEGGVPGGGGSGEGGGGADSGPPVGTKLYDGDGNEYTHMGNNVWSPQPNFGALTVQWHGVMPDGTTFGFLDTNGNGVVDSVDMFRDGTPDVSFSEEGGGGQGGVPPVGLCVDYDCDSICDNTHLGNDLWTDDNWPESLDGTCVDENADGNAEGCIVLSGSTFYYDHGCDGTLDDAIGSEGPPED